MLNRLAPLLSLLLTNGFVAGYHTGHDLRPGITSPGVLPMIPRVPPLPEGRVVGPGLSKYPPQTPSVPDRRKLEWRAGMKVLVNAKSLQHQPMVPRNTHRTRQRLRPLCATLVLPFLLSGCFTFGLWGVYLEDERDPFTGRETASYVYDKSTEWSWSLFLMRVILTPVTLCLDCLTAPVQAILADDDDQNCRRNERKKERLPVTTQGL